MSKQSAAELPISPSEPSPTKPDETLPTATAIPTTAPPAKPTSEFKDDVQAPSSGLPSTAGPQTQVTSNQTSNVKASLSGEPSSGDMGTNTEQMESSVATLKPTRHQFLKIETPPYIDPTPPTPAGSKPPSRTNSGHRSKHHGSEVSPTRSDAGYDDRRFTSEDEQEGTSRSEIQSIMEQFPRRAVGPIPPAQHPPRKSSLEPLAPSIAQQIQDLQGLRVNSQSPVSVRSKTKERETDEAGPPVPPKDGPSDETFASETSMSPTSTAHRPPPPEPEPEPTLPFDFHRFLEQLQKKKADPVARYLKSFLQEFGKRQWMVHEQVKIIGDFLAFIANKMAQCEVWRDVSDAEFDNAREGMEKLVMNRLYTQTFSPAIPPPQPIPGAKPRRRGGERPMGPGRRGQHQEDVERDEILTQKINIYGWVREGHLDIPPVSESGKRFLTLAQQELLKIRSYRAPRDKIICVLNCCKVIFGLLKNAKSDTSADSFMPLLIYVVLQCNPDHLVSNVQYILRFRNQEKLGGEAGYYLSSLMGAIQFIENMDRTTLTITDEQFEKNVETAVSAIAERHRAEEASPPAEHHSDKAGVNSGAESSARPSIDPDSPGTPRRSISSDQSDDGAAITGLLRTIQKPLSTIGRMFSDEPSAAGPSSPARTPQQEAAPSRPSPLASGENTTSLDSRLHLSAQEAAARQASAEAAEAQRVSRAEHHNVVETLAGMFPDLDRDIISDVVYQKEGR
ncbi:vacuolar protein sorting-associated protein 9 [Apiospora phragmitis]|uniref:Vacuolar protein sorting-associated protein 9 n=1 Tax=Apiospora phragmitis TaxID=2905665 RepID=A0ABR1VFS8_9PEZI